MAANKMSCGEKDTCVKRRTSSGPRQSQATMAAANANFASCSIQIRRRLGFIAPHFQATCRTA